VRPLAYQVLYHDTADSFIMSSVGLLGKKPECLTRITLFGLKYSVFWTK
jgi:hypothetical protein